MDLQSIVNVVVIIGGVCVALTNIAKFFGVPAKFFKKRAEEDFEEKFKKALKKYLPTELESHDLETRQKYLDDRQNYLNDIKKEVLKNIQSELDTVSGLNKTVNTLKEQQEALVVSAKDVLREKIMQIYFKNKKNKTLTFHEKEEALKQYYQDYKKIKGNSYIDKYYARMMSWEIVDDDDDE